MWWLLFIQWLLKYAYHNSYLYIDLHNTVVLLSVIQFLGAAFCLLFSENMDTLSLDPFIGWEGTCVVPASETIKGHKWMVHHCLKESPQILVESRTVMWCGSGQRPHRVCLNFLSSGLCDQLLLHFLDISPAASVASINTLAPLEVMLSCNTESIWGAFLLFCSTVRIFELGHTTENIKAT